MATIADLKAKFIKMRAEMPERLLQVATSVSLTGKALAERTIKEKGFGESYSTNPIPVWFFKGKQLSASGLAWIEKKEGTKKGRKTKGKPEIVADGLGTWAEFRAAQGLQTGFIDLTYSGKMWAGMFPREAYQNGDNFLAPLGHNNKEGQDEMNWNFERFGDFVGKALTGDNFDIMGNVAIDEILRLLIEPNDL